MNITIFYPLHLCKVPCHQPPIPECPANLPPSSNAQPQASDLRPVHPTSSSALRLLFLHPPPPFTFGLHPTDCSPNLLRLSLSSPQSPGPPRRRLPSSSLPSTAWRPASPPALEPPPIDGEVPSPPPPVSRGRSPAIASVTRPPTQLPAFEQPPVDCVASSPPPLVRRLRCPALHAATKPSNRLPSTAWCRRPPPLDGGGRPPAPVIRPSTSSPSPRAAAVALQW